MEVNAREYKCLGICLHMLAQYSFVYVQRKKGKKKVNPWIVTAAKFHAYNVATILPGF